MNNLINMNGIGMYDLKQKFLDYIDVSKKTTETYSIALEQFGKWLKVNNITHPQREHIIMYKNELLNNNKKTTTVSSYLIAIRQFFKWLNYEKIYPNITENVKGVKIGEINKNYLTLDQVKQIINQLDNTRDKAIFSLLVTTGLRLIELQRMDIEDISELHQEKVIYIQGKGRLDKNEYVKISDTVYNNLMQYIGERKNGAVFISTSNNNNNGRVSTKTLRLIVKEIFEKCGINRNDYTCHSLRGTFSCIAIENGASIYEISKVLRHKNIQTTTNYLRAVDRQKNKTELNVSNLIFN